MRVEGLDAEAAGVQLGTDVTVGEQHRFSLGQSRARRGERPDLALRAGAEFLELANRGGYC
ncbi:hypothetical protein GCM10009551_056950 [Nocardiopsis tropica]